MSDKIYFCGFREEHFSGWNGISPASCSLVTTTDTNSLNNIGCMTLGQAGNIIWSDISVDSQDLYFSLYVNRKSSSNSTNINFVDGKNNIINIFLTSTLISLNTGHTILPQMLYQ